MNITNGGTLISSGGPIAADFGSTGVVNITGVGSSWTVGGTTPDTDLRIGNTGNGTLNLQSGGSLRVGINDTGTITLAGETSAVARLNVGNGTAIGTLGVGQIIGGKGVGTITFSHTNPELVVNAKLTGVKDYLNPGASLFLVHSGPGKTILTSTQSTLADQVTISGGTLLVNGSISGSLTDVVVDENVITEKIVAPFAVQAGGTLGGKGFIEGRTTVDGTLTPGDGVGLLSFGGDLTLNSSATLVIELGGKVRGTSYDAMNVVGNLQYGGTLRVRLVNGFVLQNLDTFDLFNGYSSFLQTFSSIVFEDPNFTGSFVPQTGILSVFAVPEPSLALSLAAGLVTLALGRRRR